MDDVKTMAGYSEKQDLRSFFSQQYQKIVNSFRNRYGNLSEMEIEDVVSDLMTELFDRADISAQIENTGAFIYRSVQNRIIDYLRRKKKTLSLDTSLEEAGDEQSPEIRKTIVGRGYDMDAQFDSIEIRERLVLALDLLKAAERSIWVATEIEGYRFRELAELWNTPMGTLLARKHRANAALQKHLHDLKNF